MEDRLSFDEVVRVLSDQVLIKADAAFGAGSRELRGYGMRSCVHAWTIRVVNEGWDEGMVRLALRCIGFHIPGRTTSQY